MSDCAGCRKKSDCNVVDADWFPPGSIVYCRPQVLWYLMNADVIRDGKWPPQPTGSSYTDPAIRSKAVKIPSMAAALIAAEIDWRLECCGVDGKLLEAQIIAGKQLDRESVTSMVYISGSQRKCVLKYCPFCKDGDGKYKYELKVYQGDSQRLYCGHCGKVRSVWALKRRHYSQWKSHGKLD